MIIMSKKTWTSFKIKLCSQILGGHMFWGDRLSPCRRMGTFVTSLPVLPIQWPGEGWV